MLKQFKIITLAPTCFGSHRNHHQGAVLCLAKTTEYGFFCARRYRRSQYRQAQKKPYSVVLAKHRTAP